MISIVDYGLGNIRAFFNIYKSLNIPVQIASTPEILQTSTSIILPGVGSFDWAINKLNNSGLRPCLEDLVLEKKIPVLGICVGMQIMADQSEEGSLPGLGWIKGEVKKFTIKSIEKYQRDNQIMILPHMGWNNLTKINDSDLFIDIIDHYYYFLHSYYFVPLDEESSLTKTDYYKSFSSSISSQNIYAVQFHPEKSHAAGVRLLENFSKID
tara:strand:+ start:648 stop:1280 length:633 start_codon:yes stop_codon:yes gene_type:complete